MSDSKMLNVCLNLIFDQPLNMQNIRKTARYHSIELVTIMTKALRFGPLLAHNHEFLQKVFMGWKKYLKLYEQYLEDLSLGTRYILV